MAVHLPLFLDPTILPTKKYHVSFSEVYTHNECAFKHKLKYIDGQTEPDNHHMLYGREIHTVLQDWLLNQNSAFFDWDAAIQKCQERLFEMFLSTPPFEDELGVLMKDWIEPIKRILQYVPSWMDQTFPDWQLVAAEFYLFEPIEGQENKWFKGFIDCIIKVPKPKKKGSKTPPGYIYWILDWKTTAAGWNKRQKQDKLKIMQLALYKHYFSVKTGIPLEDIRCGFILLKRTVKTTCCELVNESVSDKDRKEALRLVAASVSMITKRYWVKNRSACRFCHFRGTSLCP